MSVLEDELQDLKDDLEDSRDITGEAQGPLPEPDRTQVADKLDSAESHVDKIQDPHQDPSLNPVDAGKIDEDVTPTTLPDHAEACASLAQEAHTESTAQDPDHELIGTKLKTIKSLLPEYRRLAGIT